MSGWGSFASFRNPDCLEALSFSHHQAVCGLPRELENELLAWCLKDVPENRARRSMNLVAQFEDRANPRHRDFRKDYVQSYLRRFGAHKCEANALIVRPQEERELCRQAI